MYGNSPQRRGASQIVGTLIPLLAHGSSTLTLPLRGLMKDAQAGGVFARVCLQFKGARDVTVFGVAVCLSFESDGELDRVSQQHRICLDTHLKKVLFLG